MATDKIESGKPGANGYAGIAVNKANQPREFRIRGEWKRWEPKGMQGDRVKLTAAEMESDDFKSVTKYFSVIKA